MEALMNKNLMNKKSLFLLSLLLIGLMQPIVANRTPKKIFSSIKKSCKRILGSLESPITLESPNTSTLVGITIITLIFADIFADIAYNFYQKVQNNTSSSWLPKPGPCQERIDQYTENNEQYASLADTFDTQGIDTCDQASMFDVINFHKTSLPENVKNKINPHGILLYGPPGTGKSFVAKEIARAADCTFQLVAPSDVPRPENIASIFKETRSFDKCTALFLDELDAIGKPSSKQLNELLIQTTEDGNEKILLMGATNYKDTIAPSLKRSGRFDHLVKTNLPNEQVRTKILTEMNERSGLNLDDKTIKLTAASCKDCSYADLENVITQSQLQALSRNPSTIEIKSEDLLGAAQNVAYKVSISK